MLQITDLEFNAAALNSLIHDSIHDSDSGISTSSAKKIKKIQLNRVFFKTVSVRFSFANFLTDVSFSFEDLTIEAEMGNFRERAESAFDNSSSSSTVCGTDEEGSGSDEEFASGVGEDDMFLDNLDESIPDDMVSGWLHVILKHLEIDFLRCLILLKIGKENVAIDIDEVQFYNTFPVQPECTREGGQVNEVDNRKLLQLANVSATVSSSDGNQVVSLEEL